MTTRLIFVGGFLGAGKTTLLYNAAREVAKRGLKVGLITNDQAPDLVDTAFLAQDGFGVEEVAGSCFCCNFPGLMAAIETLVSRGAAVILAEPVGSCTDLSATLCQPIKDRYADRIQLSPLSVLADPARLQEALACDVEGASLDPAAAYIYRLQLEEADEILINKIDLLDDAARGSLLAAVQMHCPQADVRLVAGEQGTGLASWLEAMLDPTRAAGRTILTVDYDRYAAGEAVLGWLNAALDLSAPAADWSALPGAIVRTLQVASQARGAEIGHLKVLLEAGDHLVIANCTTNAGSVTERGVIPAATAARLTLNARVTMGPEQLELLVRTVLAEVVVGSGISLVIRELSCLSPGYPQPSYRYGAVV